MLIPETVLQGRYRVIRQLGQGGMGAVYEAVDQRLDSTVALKETLFADERLRKQFEREARLLARMHHPALPRVSDHFSEGDGQFLVMQFIAGDDLAEMSARKGGPFSAVEVLTWADQLLDALDYLHTQDPQIIHRDIKPQNLKLTSRGQIILLDFGLAKGHASEISRITTSASIFGYTPNYAPLEQIQGLGTDARSDIYALAATLYHLVTGVKPPDALTRAAAIVNGQPDPLRSANEVNSIVPSAVAAVLERAMAQNRDQRYPNAVEMRTALKHAGSEATAVNRSEANTVLFPAVGPTVSANTRAIAQQPTLPSGETTIVVDPRKRPGSRWAFLAAAAVLLIAGVGGFYAYQQQKHPASVNLPAANREASPVPTQNQPAGGEVSSAPSAIDASEESKKVEADTQQATAAEGPVKKQEKLAKPREAPAKQSETAPTDRTAASGEGRTQQVPKEPEIPDVNPTEAPQVGHPPRVMRRNGVVTRNLPDGTQILATPDGTRVVIWPDGTRQVFRPGQRINRRTLRRP